MVSVIFGALLTFSHLGICHLVCGGKCNSFYGCRLSWCWHKKTWLRCILLRGGKNIKHQGECFVFPFPSVNESLNTWKRIICADIKGSKALVENIQKASMQDWSLACESLAKRRTEFCLESTLVQRDVQFNHFFPYLYILFHGWHNMWCQKLAWSGILQLFCVKFHEREKATEQIWLCIGSLSFLQDSTLCVDSCLFRWHWVILIL